MSLLLSHTLSTHTDWIPNLFIATQINQLSKQSINASFGPLQDVEENLGICAQLSISHDFDILQCFLDNNVRSADNHRGRA